ncbi:MAG: PDZ domain-containing protein [Candidatus Komeilibacteria bacterium]
MANFQHFIRPTAERPPSLVSVTIVSALVGLVTGAAGFSLMRAIYPADTIITGSGNDTTNIKIKFDEPLTVVANQLDQHLAAVYTHVEQSGQAINQLYSDKEYIGTALIATSDGWLIFPAGAVLPAQIDIVVNNKVYRPSEQSIDSVAGVRFIKIDASNLSPIRFARDDELYQGSTLVFEQAHLVAGYLFDRTIVRQVNAIDSTSKASQVHGPSLVDQTTLTEYVSSDPMFFFGLSGSVVGLGQNGKMLPAYYLNAAVDKFLAKSSYVSVGLYYLDLYRLPGHKEDEGVLVYNPAKAAVVVNSPASKAGIKPGDIITAVGGTAISLTNNNSLGKLLLGYKAGDSTKLTVIRASKQQEITVQF